MMRDNTNEFDRNMRKQYRSGKSDVLGDYGFSNGRMCRRLHGYLLAERGGMRDAKVARKKVQNRDA
jgi:hypothetical protein